MLYVADAEKWERELTAYENALEAARIEAPSIWAYMLGLITTENQKLQ